MDAHERILREYSYEEYLDEWFNKFGYDDNPRTLHGYNYGKRFPYVVNKLSKEEFEQHKEIVIQCHIEYLNSSGDGKKMDEALDKAFPHECQMLL